MPRFTHTALAMSLGALLLAAPMAQAASSTDPYRPTKSDKFNEKATGAVLGGALYVADPTQPVVFTFLYDDDLFHKATTVYWRDGVDGAWQELFSENEYRYAKNNTIAPFELTATSDQVFFAVEIYHKGLSKNTGNYRFSTGDGSYDIKPATSTINVGKGYAHSYVFYDYVGTGNPDNVANLALIGFEDTPKFVLSDWDDFIFTVSNVSQSPVPEPETYAMLLAGLGIIGMVARRRRTQV